MRRAQDPEFFAEVVRPFVACKRTLTFLDQWLLGHDLSPYLRMHRFATLNAAEQALLCSRLPDATGACLGPGYLREPGCARSASAQRARQC